MIIELSAGVTPSRRDNLKIMVFYGSYVLFQCFLLPIHGNTGKPNKTCTDGVQNNGNTNKSGTHGAQNIGKPDMIIHEEPKALEKQVKSKKAMI